MSGPQFYTNTTIDPLKLQKRELKAAIASSCRCWGHKIYLSYDKDNGWSFVSLNIFRRILRFLHLMNSSTLSKNLFKKNEPGTSENDYLNKQLSKIWSKKFPTDPKSECIIKNPFFQSPRFAEITNEFDLVSLKLTVTTCINYLSLAKTKEEEDYLFSYLKGIDPNQVRPIYIFRMAKFLVEKEFNHLSQETVETAEQLALETLNRATLGFHGTNLHAFKHIETQGLIREKAHLDVAEITEINRILTNAGITAFPFLMKQVQEDKGCIYLSFDPRHAFDYAQRSPEWFSEFLVSITRYGKYEGCLERVTTALNRLKENNKISAEDSERVLAFTKKYNGYFGQTTSIVCVVKNVFKNLGNDWQATLDELKLNRTLVKVQDVWDQAEAFFLSITRQIDLAITEYDFSTKDILAFEIPVANSGVIQNSRLSV